MATVELYLCVPFALKEQMKAQHKLKWNNNLKLWYTTSKTTFMSLKAFHVINLDVVYDKKEKAKKLGAQWNNPRGKWITGKSNYEKNISAYLACGEDIESEPDETSVDEDEVEEDFTPVVKKNKIVIDEDI